jgi:sulfite exporter TauE/SafE
MVNPIYSLAFLTGLLGSGHCIGMCGGIVAALSFSGKKYRPGFLFHLFYNGGRTGTYTAIGALVGALGSVMAYTKNFAWLTRFVLVCSDLFVIFIGLGTAGLFRKWNILQLEVGSPVAIMTRAVSGLQRLPAALRPLPLGALMGFLPCGFLYAMFITAAQTADPRQGAITMFFFGLGTAPALLLFGGTASLISVSVRGRMLQLAGGMVALMGGYSLYRHAAMIEWILAAVPFKRICCP